MTLRAQLQEYILFEEDMNDVMKIVEDEFERRIYELYHKTRAIGVTQIENGNKTEGDE